MPDIEEVTPKFTVKRDDFTYSTQSLEHQSPDPDGGHRAIGVHYNGLTKRVAISVKGKDVLAQRVVAFHTKAQVEAVINMLQEVVKEMPDVAV